MNNEEILKPLFTLLYEKIKNKQFVIDKSGTECVEEIAYQLNGLNPNQPLLNFRERKTNEKYCEKELEWYLSQSLSIIGYVDNIKIWQQVCTKDEKKEVNSNYGYLIFSKENGNQYDNVVAELVRNKESRRATMEYISSDIWIKYNRNGMSDFICTLSVQCHIRDNYLFYFVNQRSCDAVFGFFNDFFWHCYVYNKLYNELKLTYNNLKIGTINFNFNSFHLYSRHFNTFIKMIEYTYKINCKIYKITNLINNKIYIGKTQFSIIDRFNSHCHAAFTLNSNLYLSRALRKHGKDNFKIECLLDNLYVDDSYNKEIEYIKLYNSNNNNFGYNMTKGGKGTIGISRKKATPETIEKMKSRPHIYRKGKDNPLYYVIPKNIELEIINLYVNKLYNLNDIAKLYNFHRRLVARCLKENNIKIDKYRISKRK